MAERVKRIEEMTFPELIPIIKSVGSVPCVVVDAYGGSLTPVEGELTLGREEGEWQTLHHPGFRQGGYPVKGGHVVPIGSITRGPTIKGLVRV